MSYILLFHHPFPPPSIIFQYFRETPEEHAARNLTNENYFESNKNGQKRDAAHDKHIGYRAPLLNAYNTQFSEKWIAKKYKNILHGDFDARFFAALISAGIPQRRVEAGGWRNLEEFKGIK